MALARGVLGLRKVAVAISSRSAGVSLRGSTEAGASRAKAYASKATGGREALEREHPWENTSLRLIKFATWASTVGIGVYLVVGHDWQGPDGSKTSRRNVFSDLKPAIRRLVTELHGGAGEGAKKSEEPRGGK